MAGGLISVERRQVPRARPHESRWSPVAVLRPGQVVALIDVGRGGARLVSSLRMKPGARAELQLQGLSRRIISGRIARCRVTQLSPLRYEAAIVFDEPLD